MTGRHRILIVGISIALSIPAAAQHDHNMQPTDNQKQHMSDMMGKPTFEHTASGLNVRIWLVTQAEHKQMMKDRGMLGGTRMDRHEMMGMMHSNKEKSGDHQMMNGQMQHDSKAMDEEMMKTMLSGTHHIMVIVRDEASKAESEGAEVEVQTVSPTDNGSTLMLRRMSEHYGGGLTLEERGRYRINVMVRVAGREVNAGFDYAARLSDQ